MIGRYIIVAEVWKCVGFMLLGALCSEYYNMRIWRGYREGRRDGREPIDPRKR